MSLASEIAPHLPFLRRYARAIVGNQAEADELVRRTLDWILSNHEDFPQRVSPRLGLYKVFHQVFAAEAEEISGGQDAEADARELVAYQRLGRIAPLARQALLLTSLEGFDERDTGYLLQLPRSEVTDLVAEALGEIERQTQTTILVAEPDSNQAAQIQEAIEALGHEMGGIARSRAEVVRLARAKPPGLLISEALLDDGFTGVEAARTITSRYQCPVIFLTNHPEQLLEGGRPEPTFLITKPFQISTLKAAIAQALFFDRPIDALPPAEQPDRIDAQLNRNEIRQALRPHPAPVDADVVDGQLTLASPKTPKSRIASDALDALRADFQEDVARLLQLPSNIGPAFGIRLRRLNSLLDEPLTELTALRIANQVEALAEFRIAVEEALNPSDAADVMATIASMRDFVRQFPIWKTFQKEAAEASPLPPEAEEALRQVSEVIEHQPDEIVSPDLKDAMAEVRETSEESGLAGAAFAFARGVSNVTKAIARYLLERIKGAGLEFNKAIDEQLGGGLATVASNLLIAASTPLLTLAAHLPAEFFWVGPLIAAARQGTGKK